VYNIKKIPVQKAIIDPLHNYQVLVLSLKGELQKERFELLLQEHSQPTSHSFQLYPCSYAVFDMLIRRKYPKCSDCCLTWGMWTAKPIALCGLKIERELTWAAGGSSASAAILCAVASSSSRQICLKSSTKTRLSHNLNNVFIRATTSDLCRRLLLTW